MFLDRLCDFSGRRVRGTGVSLSARKVWPTKQRSSRATLVAHRGLRHGVHGSKRSVQRYLKVLEG